MRRWKVIERSVGYSVGDIVTLYKKNEVEGLWFKSDDNRAYSGCYLDRLVEIDEQGNTIRTYKGGDTLDGGTLVKQEEKKMEGLEGVSMEVPVMCEKIEGCENCPLHGKHYNSTCTAILAAEVQRLRDEREKNPGVWDNAPEWAVKAKVCYYREGRDFVADTGTDYTRELPKTLEQEIAENLVETFSDNFCELTANQKTELCNLAERGMLEFKERTK